MKLRDNELLGQYLEHKDMTQARLARYVECSRQFISQLVNGHKNTCTPDVAKRIEEALDLIPGTLFDPKESYSAGQAVNNKRTNGKAA
jgi:plasmid maintenance system antidote protein VapI